MTTSASSPCVFHHHSWPETVYAPVCAGILHENGVCLLEQHAPQEFREPVCGQGHQQCLTRIAALYARYTSAISVPGNRKSRIGSSCTPCFISRAARQQRALNDKGLTWESKLRVANDPAHFHRRKGIGSRSTGRSIRCRMTYCIFLWRVIANLRVASHRIKLSSGMARSNENVHKARLVLIFAGEIHATRTSQVTAARPIDAHDAASKDVREDGRNGRRCANVAAAEGLLQKACWKHVMIRSAVNSQRTEHVRTSHVHRSKNNTHKRVIHRIDSHHAIYDA